MNKAQTVLEVSETPGDEGRITVGENHLAASAVILAPNPEKVDHFILAGRSETGVENVIDDGQSAPLRLAL